MRADRLIAALMVLQARGGITASELAAELEVSERTARRDLEALAMSGVPIYSQAGRGGGWRLIGGARTDLTGLSSEESRALFLGLSDGVERDPMLEAALRKLLVALPERFRDDAIAAAQPGPGAILQSAIEPHVMAARPTRRRSRRTRFRSHRRGLDHR